MQTDLEGRVARLRRSDNKPLYPLFEAVSNSLHSLEQLKASDGHVTVTIDRLPPLRAAGGGELTPGDIHGFTVTDNGAGFTSENYRSFETLDSRLKLRIGGKGVGRLLWLLVFDEVAVDSTYREDSGWWRRRFRFSRHGTGIADHRCEAVMGPDAVARTAITLRGVRAPWRERVPRTAETIGRHIIDHFLEGFILNALPAISVHDSALGLPLALQEYFEACFDPDSQDEPIDIQGQKFRVRHALMRGRTDRPHQMLFTAHGRAVVDMAVARYVPHLETALVDAQGRSVTYVGCISGDLLDARVNTLRTGFSLPRDGELAGAEEVTEADLQTAARAAAARFLAPLTAERRERARQRAQEVIAHDLPHLRPVLANRLAEVESLPTALEPHTYREQLERLNLDWKLEVGRTAGATLEAIAKQPDTLPRLREQARVALARIAEVQSSELAEYLLHRRLVLQHMCTLLGPDDEGRLPAEADLHRLIFPIRKTSDDVDDESHNLWLLDEGLVYHHFLASDLPFDQQMRAPVSVDSEERTDILAYNVPMALVEGEPGSTPITIIEFKRPETKPHGKRSPIDQVFDYIDRIQAGKAKTPRGVTIEVNPQNTRFYCHVVAHLTPDVVAACLRHTLKPFPEGGGFYGYIEAYNAWFEVKSWQRVVQAANRRHQAFWRRLSLNSPVKL